VAAIDTVRAACQRHGRRLGIFGATPSLVLPRLAEGYTLVCCGADIPLFAAGARDLLATLRAGGTPS